MTTEGAPVENPFEILIQNLASNEKIVCKSQQKTEADLTAQEKAKILTELLDQNKATFLFRFGHFMTGDQLKLFEEFQHHPEMGYEISNTLQNIQRANSTKCIKNRRFFAIKRLVKEDYFSENEMRRRNPLLYDQLVGSYLSDKEKQHVRDAQAGASKTLVDVLMEGFENEELEKVRNRQEDAENAQEEEEEPSSSSSEDEHFATPDQMIKGRSLWGEIPSSTSRKTTTKPCNKNSPVTAHERNLLKDEFYNTMFESFIEGTDDYDYSNIDNNEEYDSVEFLDQDEEEKYFDADEDEEPKQDVMVTEQDGSEDELEVYMSALNQNLVVSNLTDGIKKL